MYILLEINHCHEKAPLKRARILPKKSYGSCLHRFCIAVSGNAQNTTYAIPHNSTGRDLTSRGLHTWEGPANLNLSEDNPAGRRLELSALLFVAFFINFVIVSFVNLFALKPGFRNVLLGRSSAGGKKFHHFLRSVRFYSLTLTRRISRNLAAVPLITVVACIAHGHLVSTSEPISRRRAK